MADENQRLKWREATRRYRESRRELLREKQNARRSARPADHRDAVQRSRSKDPDRAREHSRRYSKARPEIGAANAALRRARIKQQTPPWSDLVACRGFYEIAARVSRCTGIPFDVDHIIPLCGDGVCGLHVPINLRVIPRKANQRKSNRIIGSQL